MYTGILILVLPFPPCPSLGSKKQCISQLPTLLFFSFSTISLSSVSDACMCMGVRLSTGVWAIFQYPHHLRKMTLSHSNHQLSIALSWEWGLLGFCLSCSFAGYHGYWEFMSAVPHTVQKTARHRGPSSLAYSFPTALQQCPLSLGSEGDIDVPARDGRSALILSALTSRDFCLFLWIWVVFCFLISL